MKPYFIAYEVTMESRDLVEDFDGVYEDISLQIRLKSSGNAVHMTSGGIVGKILILLEKIETE
jgi:hypothetical protein